MYVTGTEDTGSVSYTHLDVYKRQADGRWRHLAAPQSLRNILHTPDGYACQVHLHESFFHTALPTAIPLNDGGLKGNPFELGYLKGNVPGSGGEAAAVVAAAITLPLLIALVPGRLVQLLRLGLQQFRCV